VFFHEGAFMSSQQHLKDLLIQGREDLEIWKIFVHDSAVIAGVRLPELLESYLVFLLMRFMRSPEIADTVFAFDYLQAQQLQGVAKQDLLRELADKCLLFAGLYPEQAIKKGVEVDYFIRLGKTAYLTLSDLTALSLAELYYHLSEDFILLMNVLLASWEFNPSRHGDKADLIKSYKSYLPYHYN
jgi:hypothetical protein